MIKITRQFFQGQDGLFWYIKVKKNERKISFIKLTFTI